MKLLCCVGAAAKLRRVFFLFTVCLFLQQISNLLLLINTSRRRGGNLPPAKDCEAALSLDRGASAPLIIAFFLIVVFYAPSLLIGVCAIGYLGWVGLIVWV